MNYYPFHLGDYAAHTAHLEPLEDLAYRRMLDAYYLREGPLPANAAEVARLIRLRQNLAEVEAVLREFFVPTEQGWRHARCDDELERMQDKQAKARASAAASVSSRRANAQRTLSERSTNAERTLNERSTDVELPTPTPTPKETPLPPKGEVVDNFWFTRWWEAWPKHPRKAARVQCERKWQALGCEALGEQIVASVEAHKASAGWAKDDGAFVPAPLVWLNQRRWEAPIAAPKKAEIWVPPPPMSAAERAAADEVRRRVVTALRGRVAA